MGVILPKKLQHGQFLLQNWHTEQILGHVANTRSLEATLLSVLGQSLQEYTMIFRVIIPFMNLLFWLIDSWDDGDTFSIKFDDTSLPFWNEIAHTDFIWGNACGSGYPDIVNLEISGQIPHNKSSLTLQVVSSLDGNTNDELIGFRGFTFLFATTSSQRRLPIARI